VQSAAPNLAARVRVVVARAVETEADAEGANGCRQLLLPRSLLRARLVRLVGALVNNKLQQRVNNAQQQVQHVDDALRNNSTREEARTRPHVVNVLQFQVRRGLAAASPSCRATLPRVRHHSRMRSAQKAQETPVKDSAGASTHVARAHLRSHARVTSVFSLCVHTHQMQK